jgi:hypothetical protein
LVARGTNRTPQYWEADMYKVIDLGTELLVDQTTIRDPYLRLLAVAIGQKLIAGSPWLAIDKAVVQACRISKAFNSRKSIRDE